MCGHVPWVRIGIIKECKLRFPRMHPYIPLLGNCYVLCALLVTIRRVPARFGE